MNNVESFRQNQEQLPDTNGTKWDDLKDVPHPQFNRIDDKNELRLRNELMRASEQFSKDERAIYGLLSEELAKSNLSSLSKTVEELGAGSSQLDSERYQTMLDYLDNKFSDEINSGEKEKITTELRESYLKNTRAREGLFEDSTRDIWNNLSRSDDRAFEEPAYYVNEIRKNMPGQTSIAEAYFEYFDNPTDERLRQRLNGRVDEYTYSFRNRLGHLSETVHSNTIGTSALPDVLNNRLGSSMSRDYENIHSAIMHYFDHKMEKASPTTTNNENDTKNPPISSLPSDIF